MPVFENLMLRLGFVRLRRYGLVHTSEDRIASTRTHVLDQDGTPVVGWRDADLAAAELRQWGRAKTSPVRIVGPKTAPMAAVAEPKAVRAPTPLPIKPASPAVTRKKTQRMPTAPILASDTAATKSDPETANGMARVEQITARQRFPR